jgi:urease accessory protein
MTYERVTGRLDDADDPAIDWVEIDYAQTLRRALRLVSVKGDRVNILLPRTHAPLRHLDLLASHLAIRVRPAALLRLTSPDPQALQRAASELGNLHAPVEFAPDALIALDDGPTRELADQLRLNVEPFVAPFHPHRYLTGVRFDTPTR